MSGGSHSVGGTTMSRFVKFLFERPNIHRGAVIVVFFVLWELVARDANPFFMTYPSAILAAFQKLIASGELATALLASMVPFAIGMAISIVLGFVIGVVIGQWWYWERTLDPFIDALYAIPRVALIPLVILWAGLGVTGKVTILVSLAIFPVIINTYSGIRDVRGAYLEVARAFGATESQIFFKVTLPAIVPFVMAGIRMAVGLAIVGTVIAEFFTALTGLGGMIVTYANVFATDKVFVPIIVVALMGVGMTELVRLVEKRFSRWRVLERQHTNAG